MHEQNLKPVEVVYEGYRFRSTLEARWAVFFDSIKKFDTQCNYEFDWRYEEETFDLGDSIYYTPDFRINEGSIFLHYIEVKPSLDIISDDELSKYFIFREILRENMKILREENKFESKIMKVNQFLIYVGEPYHENYKIYFLGKPYDLIECDHLDHMIYSIEENQRKRVLEQSYKNARSHRFVKW